MPSKRTPSNIAADLAKAIFERKTSQGRGNKIIDAFFEDNFAKDESLHFINEVIIHKHPRQHIRNTMEYGIKPRIPKLARKLLGL